MENLTLVQASIIQNDRTKSSTIIILINTVHSEIDVICDVIWVMKTN